jgi:hypothetical protein
MNRLFNLRGRAAMASWIACLACAALALVGACTGNPPYLQDPDGSSIIPSGTCDTPHPGCGCSTENAQTACGEVVRQSGDYVTCSEGTMTCTGGVWGACIGDQVYMKSTGPIGVGGLQTQDLQTNPTPCANDPCDPSCTDYVDNGAGLDAGAGLATDDAGGVTLLPEGGGCTGYQCQITNCTGVDGGTPTTLTGTVYDPAGLNPIYHAYVYIPNALPLPTITTGPQLDPCGGGGNLPPAAAWYYTGPDGKFTLTNVPSGSNIPLVVQSGKWRRMVVLSSVNACTTTAVPATDTHLPQNQTDGYNNQADLPQMAIVAASCDPMECLIRRIGVSDSEFTSPGTGGHIDYYQGYGTPLTNGTNPTPDNLLGDSTQMMKEDLVILPCDCGDEYYTTRNASGRWAGNYTTFLDNIVSYTSNGGRLFSSHWGRQWIEGGGVYNPFPGVANWQTSGSANTPWFEGQINTTFTEGQDFATWMQNVGASPSYGTMLIQPARYDTSSVNSPTTDWVDFTGRTTSDGVTFSTGAATGPADFTFDTPLNQTSQYGRVMFTDMHLASGLLSSSFPAECPTGALTAQEKAAEFLLFDLGACLTPVTPPPPTYYSAVFTRDYEGVCPAGQSVVWRFFDWQTVTPSDSSIVFNAQTADTQALLPTATPVVYLGTASGAPITNWTGTDVSLALAPNPSRAWLRVTMIFNPSSDHLSTPTLTAWRQQYDCVDSQ